MHCSVSGSSVLLLFLLVHSTGTGTAQTIKFGVLLSTGNQANNAQYIRALSAASRDVWDSSKSTATDYNVSIFRYSLNDTESSIRILEILCEMVEHEVNGFVSVVENARKDRFVTDMARSLNLLHISASPFVLNLFHSSRHIDERRTPLVYSDFDCETINDLLYSFISSEKFRWKRIEVIYDSIYGVATLNSFMARARHRKWFISVRAVPEEIANAETEEEQLQASASFNWTLVRADRYFILQMNIAKAAAFLRLALYNNMTKNSYYYLITHPINHEEEQKLLQTTLRQTANEVHLLTIHRPFNDELQHTINSISSGLKYGTDLLASYSKATAEARANVSEGEWPIRYDNLPDYPKSCVAAAAKFATRITSKSFELDHLDNVTGAKLLRNSALNQFQAHYQRSIHGATFGQIAIVELSPDERGQTHKVVYPCDNCDDKDITSSSLRVIGFVDPPYVMPNYNYDNGTRPFEGYCVDILEEIGRRLKIDLIWSVAPDPVTGRRSNTYGWTGIVKELKDGNADISLNLIEMSPIRTNAISFSEPIFSGGNVALANLNVTTGQELFAFLKPFDYTLWLALVGVIIVCSCCFWIISVLLNWTASDDCCTCCSCSAQAQKEAQQQSNANGSGLVKQEAKVQSVFSNGEYEKMSYGDCLWYTVAIILCKSCEVAPHSFSGKLLTAFLAFFTVIIVGYYTANLTAFLAVQKKSVAIKSIDALSKSDLDMRILSDSATFLFLRESRSTDTYNNIFLHVTTLPPPNRGFIKTNAEGVLLAKNRSSNVAWIGDTRAIEYWLTKHPCVEDMTIIGEEFGKQGRAFGFPLGSPNVKKFNTILLEMQEAGDIKKFEDRWFKPKPECDMNKVLIKEISYASFTEAMHLPSIYGVLIILASGIVIAVLLVIYKLIKVHSLKKTLSQLASGQQ